MTTKAVPLYLPDTAKYGLMATAILLAIPHLEGIPWWTFIPSSLVVAWLFGELRWQWRTMPAVMRTVLAVGSLLAIAGHYRSIHNLDAYVALLMMMQAQKLLELNSARDLYLAVFIGFIAAITRLLYIQAFTDMFVAISTAIVLFYVLYTRYVSVSVSVWRALRNVLLLLLKASPLIAVLFFLVPRVPPLLVIPELGGSGKTGVSGSVAPGSLKSLAQSREPAFRASFDGDIPELSLLYWRGVVMEAFNGTAWRIFNVKEVDRSWLTESVEEPALLRYSVNMEPTNQHWLFSLPVSQSLTADTGDLQGFVSGSKNPITAAKRFDFVSASVPLREGLTKGRQRFLTQLPKASNPQSVALGQSLAQQFAQPSAIVAELNRLFAAEFFYSLNPPPLGRDSADDFLFGTKTGYCEHFAHAAGVVLRAAGIPTRLVGGYLGGEVNQFEAYVLVRQLDAHAWLEYWVPEQGWIRFDPTAAVAPERITRGSEASLRARDELLDGGWSTSNWQLLRDMYMWADAMNYQWARWLEDFDSSQQSSLLEGLTGLKGGSELLMQVFIIAVLVVTLPFGLIAMWSALYARAPFGTVFQLAEAAIALMGLKRPVAVTPLVWSQRADTPRSYRQLVNFLYPIWFKQERPNLAALLMLPLYLLRLWTWAILTHLSGNRPQTVEKLK